MFASFQIVLAIFGIKYRLNINWFSNFYYQNIILEGSKFMYL